MQHKKATRIKLPMRFYKSEDGNLLGFVSKYNGKFHSVHPDNSLPKKVVTIDAGIRFSISKGVLYHVTLVPMHSGNGFVAIRAIPAKFKAKITASYGANPCIMVEYGSSHLAFRPYSHEAHQNDMNRVADNIRKKIDILDADKVADEFLMVAGDFMLHFKQSA